jgi:cytochrome c556
MQSFFKHVVVTAVLLASLAVAAQDRKIEQSIKHRKAAFTLMSTYFSRLLQTVEGDRPFDKALVAADAKTVALLARLPWEGFVPGSESGDTKAKEDIWFEEAQFKKLADELQFKSAALAKVAESGELKAIKTAFDATRDTCNVCHKAFRQR